MLEQVSPQSRVNVLNDPRPHSGWELESAQWAAARAAQDFDRLQHTNADRHMLELAERRYRNALGLLQRIRTLLNDSSTAE